jgi:phenylpyruvate tautomerase PptA (4-oxalocrotonate tautomerase family)
MTMPIIRIDITGPKTPEWKRALLAGTRAAVSESLGVPDARITARVTETPDDCVDVPDCRTDRFTIVEVIMYEGRTDAMKHELVAAIRSRWAASPGVESSEVTVIIRDPSRVDLDVPPGDAGT